ncbi:thiol reductant ABC exporter subunit CydD [Brachybacterium halotolerans subsp. kimchii]|uniref:thiol reductant ABC exporter subunit CydD n=1 Tax=Brachybacterium halotolerans TaxID=2795215 RepID=UPI001E6460AF|nr:thiol reductant ABC exporter subunit CydD [Brachybacterium halotolerans]UEJ83023.1 thiol reductant ABC exporter subunit CydD [Brachybacterium halotolerans subsp. kimchii]
MDQATPGTGRRSGERRPPLDPRLLREVAAARRHVVRTTALGLVQAGAVIATALLLARLGADLLVDRRSPLDSPALLAALVVALGVRALAVLVEQRTAHRAATAAIADLRSRLIGHAARLGPRAGAGRGADLTTLATTGLEKLRPYLVGYVPQLLLSATVTPLTLLTILLLDPTSAGIAVITLPLVPLFMILIGRLTVGRSEALLADTRTLWSQMLDLVDGLPTLRALGRERGPETMVRALGDRHRRSTMGSLRYAFLSSMVLELLGTLCVALVAVAIGLRLVYGDMELAPALAVLVLIPEVYLPLRQVGAQFHASTDGVAAVSAAFDVLGESAPADGTAACPDLRTATLRLDGVGVRSRDGLAPHGADLVVRPGTVHAIAGASGSGKTTAVQVMLGLLVPDEGSARVVAADGTATAIQDLRRESLWSQTMLLPQRPVLPTGSLREVLTEAAPHGSADQDRLDRAARAAGLDRVIAARGWDAPVGRGGSGLSLGERQRLALARALLAPAPLVVLDEPTAHLDGATEDLVLDLVRTLRAEGRTVVLVAHRSRLLDVADEVTQLSPVHVGPDEAAEGAVR